jgi:CRISPR-associated protein (TIGR03984 family)
MATWSRIIEKHPAILTKPVLLKEVDLHKWLEEQAKNQKLKWLLVHADDGVIWGHFDGAEFTLFTSEKVACDIPEAQKSVCVPLRLETIQQARLFGPAGELLIFRTNDNEWQYRIINDISEEGKAELIEAYDEPYLLWGTHGIKVKDNFTLLSDGVQGLRHAVPLELTLGKNGETTPPQLIVRHYLNKEGVAKVVVSRLVDLVKVGG